MCGIAGIVDLASVAEIDRGLLEKMTSALAHRGPDEIGYWTDPGVGFGHRRLSIIDLSSGQQPLHSADGRVVVTYNGEIYNFQDVRRDLEARGHRFRTNCDTEVIVYAWLEWGAACVQHFRGMFAFGLWDREQQTLFLARDRVGIKPLYYTMLAGGQVLFGSELKALLCHPGVARTLDPTAVEDYFAYGYVPDPKCIYQEIHKLPPGHVLVVRRGDRTLPPARRYWDLEFDNSLAGSEQDLAAELIERLREAVEVRLIADVPLGAFLSGGVDSSAVVAMMAEISDTPVNTCSIGFDQADHDETEYANMIAQRFHTSHRSQVVDADDFDLVDSLAGYYDEPFADSSAIPTYRVCELARKGVTVALSGDGGDELFAGYRRYRWHHYEESVRSRLPNGLRRSVFGFLGHHYPKLDWAPQVLRGKSTFQALALDTAEAYFHSVSVLGNGLRDNLFSSRMRSDLQGYRAVDLLTGLIENAPAEDHIAAVQYADFKTYLPGDILTKVDRASMAHSLEVRVPILDHEFIGWASGLDASLRLRGREGKYIFKKALESRLPKDVLYRPKMGFAVPIGNWFRGPLRQRIQDTLESPFLADCGLFDMDYVRGLAAAHLSGRSNYSSALWALLMFESSLRQAGEDGQ